MEEDEAYQKFHNALEGLKSVHTSKKLRVQQRKVEEAKANLLAVSPEFQRIISEKEEAHHFKEMELNLEYAQLYNKHYKEAPKTVRKDSDLFVCPKCGRQNLNFLKVNRKTARKLHLPKGIREVPWCFRCNVKMVIGDKK